MSVLSQKVAVAALASCLVAPGEAAAGNYALMDPVTVLTTGTRVDFAGQTEFALLRTERGPFLRILPHKSSSGLYQHIDFDRRGLQRVRWTWRVDQLQPSADLRALATEDSGATVFFVFGEPSFLNRDVPTLAYVWSSTPVPDGTVVPSMRYKNLRYMQLHGPKTVGTWQVESRDVAQDYRTVFGREHGALKYVAILADNDQTGEPASALIGAIVEDQ